MSLQHPIEKAESLIEALPYLQAFRGKTFLIKMGGSAMEDPDLVAKVMRDVVFLEVAGINPIVVHGGGKAISAAMKDAGLDAEFIGGFRVTSDEAISIVEKVLSNEINPGLVRMIRDFGGKAVGIAGTDVFLGEKMHATDKEGNRVDLGRVGRVRRGDRCRPLFVHQPVLPQFRIQSRNPGLPADRGDTVPPTDFRPGKGDADRSRAKDHRAARSANDLSDPA